MLLAILPDMAALDITTLATCLGLPHEPLRKRLAAFMRENDLAFVETSNPHRGEPRYLFRIGPIRPLLTAMLADEQCKHIVSCSH